MVATRVGSASRTTRTVRAEIYPDNFHAAYPGRARHRAGVHCPHPVSRTRHLPPPTPSACSNPRRERDRRSPHVIGKTTSRSASSTSSPGRWTENRGDGIAIYHHPRAHLEHRRDHGARSTRRAAGTTGVVPAFPWAELKLSEFPALATSYAQGFPTNITFSEGIGFLTQAASRRRTSPFMVTAHEAAHQWWGNMLNPGKGRAERPVRGHGALLDDPAHESETGLRERIEFCQAHRGAATATTGAGRLGAAARAHGRLARGRPRP